MTTIDDINKRINNELAHEDIVKLNFHVSGGRVYEDVEGGSRVCDHMDSLFQTTQALYIGLDAAAFCVNDLLEAISRSHKLSMELSPQLLANARFFLQTTVSTLACARGVDIPLEDVELDVPEIAPIELAPYDDGKSDLPVGTTLSPAMLSIAMAIMTDGTDASNNIAVIPTSRLPLTLMRNIDTTNVIQVDTALWKRKRG